MCLTITRNKKFLEYFTGWRPEVAKKDMLVYKVLIKRGEVYYSEMQNYEYIKNILQPKVKLEVTQEKRWGITVDKGYHCFTKLNSVHKYRPIRDKFTICEFIIPKGTKFYRGIYDRFENLVAETIIFKGECIEANK